MTIKIIVTIHDNEVAEFELVDGDCIDIAINDESRQFVSAFMADCVDAINDHERNPGLN